MTTATVVLHVGAMCGIPSQTCLISKRTREHLGLDVGSLVKLDSEEQSTVVVRRVLKAPNIREKDRFVFLSPEDLRFLNVNIADNIKLEPDTGGVECP